jgi:alkylated DNA repair protein (DNA oxidative demethylase)
MLFGYQAADDVTTPPRSIYHLAGAARRDREHSIAAMEVTRWSITYRSLSRRD